MAKWATLALIGLCLLVAVLSLTETSDVQVSDEVLEGDRLRLLSELSDEEFGRLALPDGAGEIPVDRAADTEEFDASETAVQTEESLLSENNGQNTASTEVIFEEELLEEPVCMSLGELRSLGDINILENRLEALGLETLRVTRIVEEPGPYMVYIPPMSSEDEARNIVALLYSDGLESIIIRDPPFVNGVSLGVFRSDENSADLVTRVRGLDYNVRRRQMTVTAELHSLFLSGLELASLEESFWQEIRSDFDGIQVVQKSCEEVASASNFQ